MVCHTGPEKWFLLGTDRCNPIQIFKSLLLFKKIKKKNFFCHTTRLAGSQFPDQDRTLTIAVIVPNPNR